ncbi:hypothetical protein DBR06_SOUSAS10610016, partial [Sousa chinensis]
MKLLLFLTGLIITVPVGLYFTTKSHIFERAFDTETTMFMPILFPVVAVHVIMVLFVSEAFVFNVDNWKKCILK